MKSQTLNYERLTEYCSSFYCVVSHNTHTLLPSCLKTETFYGVERVLTVIAANNVYMTIYLHGAVFTSPCQHVGHVMPLLLSYIISLG